MSLIDGVTGSGKTEVYFEAIAETLRQGRQVLILLPEIALTPAFLERFQDRFGAKPAEWHSDHRAASMREKVWRQAAEGAGTGRGRGAVGAVPAIRGSRAGHRRRGARSPPTSRKTASSTMPATWPWCAAGSATFPVVLVSATPSVESRVNADQGRYDLSASGQPVRRGHDAGPAACGHAALSRRRAAGSCRLS